MKKTITIQPANTQVKPKNWADNIHLYWIGHSTVLINFKGIKIITDPVFSKKIGLSVFGLFTLGIKRYVEPALKLMDLPKLDAIIISHAHMDHLDIPTLKQLDTAVPIITPKHTKSIYPKNKTIIELDWGASTTIKKNGVTLTIQAFKTKHPGARMQLDTYRKSNGYVLFDDTFSIVFLGDTAYTKDFKQLKKQA